MDKIFIASSVEGVHYLRGEFVENNPINLKVCKGIEKSKFAWYPDNIGKPAISFIRCDIQWVYDNVEDRDREWNQLIKIQLKD